MKIESKINKSKDYGAQRDISEIKYIVVQSIDNGPLTHYHVVNEKVIQMIPDKFMSDSVNGARLSQSGIYHGICTKYNSLSIGINKDDGLCVHLILTLMQRYKIPPDNVIRKVDVTGEANPEIWFDNNEWGRVKKMLKSI